LDGNDHGGGLVVSGGRLVLGGETLEAYEVRREVGAGANGVAFLVRHEYLDRLEVLKVWTTLRAGDLRDKLTQGMAEARKASKSHSPFTVEMYHAETRGGLFYATMEYVHGSSLKDALRRPISLGRRWWLARLYVNAIAATTNDQMFHGDAHPGNVVVYDKEIGGNDAALSLKLIDFGTSKFSGAEVSRDRHWRVVRQTVKTILSQFGGYAGAAARPFPGEEHLVIAYFDDILDALRLEAGDQVPRF